MYLLGISAFYHDSAACLIRDGELIAAAQEERFSRVKHDHRFPKEAVRFCLEYAGVSSSDLGLVLFYDKPWIKFERLLETYLSFAPRGIASFLKAMPLWLKEKLWMGDLVKRELPGYHGEIFFPEHHQSHLASAFYPSPFEHAALLTLDGVGEWATGSWGIGRGKDLEIHQELHFPHSVGLLYSAFTYYTGFRVNSGEYKLMGLAPYGEPVYVQTILDHIVDLKDDGSIHLNQEYFRYCYGLTMTSEKFHRLFGGKPRTPETEITQKEMNLARSVQEVTEEIVLRIARHVRKETGERNLCLAGGVALNCVANGKLLRSGLFDDLWIQPAAGDAGGALGAALFGWHQVLKNERDLPADGKDLQKGSLLGPSWTTDEIASWLSREGVAHHRYTFEQVLDRTADALAAEKVVGWFRGRMEFGPRALGARSIIGDARSSKMQKTMNLKIKFRESFRPFAPSVLEETAGEYFELDRPSPYMLLVAPVRQQHRIASAGETENAFGIERLNIPRSDIPAVTHVDYSARIQTVSRETHPDYHALINRFRERTGCGVIVNTSFNVRGEPIVCTPQDAFLCFMRTDMDLLVLENCILVKEEMKPLEDDDNWREHYRLD